MHHRFTLSLKYITIIKYYNNITMTSKRKTTRHENVLVVLSCCIARIGTYQYYIICHTHIAYFEYIKRLVYTILQRLSTCGTRTNGGTQNARRWCVKKIPFIKIMEWIIVHNIIYYLVFNNNINNNCTYFFIN